MKLVATCMVKNESDIIERYIRINSRVIDTFVIADDNSCDGTEEILYQLIAEGFDIRLSTLESKELQTQYQQNVIMNDLIKTAAGLGDYVFPIDADELIFSRRKKVEERLALIPEKGHGMLTWLTFAPIGGGLRPGKRLKECFYPCIEELYPEYKCVLTSELAKDAKVTMGNHRVCGMSPCVNLALDLCHFPVRSANQIIAKSLTIDHKFAIKKDKSPTEGYHIRAIANAIRHNNYRVDDVLLNGFAHSYLGNMTNRERKSHNEFNNFREDKLCYTPLDYSPIRMLDCLLTEMLS